MVQMVDPAEVSEVIVTGQAFENRIKEFITYFNLVFGSLLLSIYNFIRLFTFRPFRGVLVSSAVVFGNVNQRLSQRALH